MLIYFVEDDENIAYVINKTLENMRLEKEGFASGKSFIEAFNNKKPDLILLDIMLPDISGIKLLETIRESSLEIPVIIVSALYSEMDKVIAFDKGADDYVTKPFGILELSSRILAKLRKLPSNDILKYGDITLEPSQYLAKINEENISFTKKEFEILSYMILNFENVHKKEDIYYKVWETNYMGNTRSLDMHIKQIRKKLLDKNSKVIIDTEYSIGYKLRINNEVD